MRFDRLTSIISALVFALALATPARADDKAEYTKHILAYSSAIKQSDYKTAEAELVAAAKVAPEAKRAGVAKALDEVRKRLATGPAATPPATKPALSGPERLAMAKFQLLLDDAKAAADPDARKTAFEQLLSETGSYLSTHPKDEGVWALRAMAAVKLSRAYEAGEAADILQKLGALDHGNQAAVDLIARIDQNKWIAQYQFVKEHPNFTNSIGVKFAVIMPGEFVMGSPEGEEGRSNNETQHKVKLTHGFMLATTPVTQAQWRAVMGTTVAQQRDQFAAGASLYGEGEAYPMYYVSWDEATEFCRKLGAKEGKRYRLPTEAEWEYACRAGTITPYGGTGNLDEMGWYSANSGQTTHPVAQKKANAWGLYDMHGNVWQWCSDGYGEYTGDATDPKGVDGSTSRVLRGGSWDGYPLYCRAAYRTGFAPGYRIIDLGFRLCLDF